MVSYKKDSKSGKEYFEFNKGELFAVIATFIAIVIVAYAWYAPLASASATASGAQTNSGASQAPSNLTANVTQPRLPLLDFVLISDSRCTDCTGAELLLQSIKQSQETLGFVSGEEKSLSSNETLAQVLISKYQIKKLPVLLIYGNISENQEFMNAWFNFGTLESDGVLVLREVFPPYIEIDTGRLRGEVEMIELLDGSCSECYNVSLFESLPRMVFSNISKYDSNSTEGKALVSKYNITLVPTVLLSAESSVYPSFDAFWVEMGTIEGDGRHIFRNMYTISGVPGGVVFRNLSSGEIQRINESVG